MLHDCVALLRGRGADGDTINQVSYEEAIKHKDTVFTETISVTSPKRWNLRIIARMESCSWQRNKSSLSKLKKYKIGTSLLLLVLH